MAALGGGTDGITHGRTRCGKQFFVSVTKTLQDINKIFGRGNITFGALPDGINAYSWVFPVLAALGGGTDGITHGRTHEQ